MAPGPGSYHHCEVAVVGAGPYGLALGAHLRAANVEVIVFGEVMSFWRQNMPQGMKLRSPWHATHLSDPDRAFTLDIYDREKPMRRAHPVPLEEFVQYGQWFQRQAVPNLDTRRVASIDQSGGGFLLTLDDGNVVFTCNVVVAMGLANQEFRPKEFDGLPAALVSHTCEHQKIAHFRGQSVAVVGRGQSACESATLLREAGAEVEIICRGKIHWLGIDSADGQGKPLATGLRELLTAPSAVGPFPLNWVVEVPGVVHRLPRQLRTRLTVRSLRAGAAGWLLPRFGGVRVNAGRTVLAAKAVADRIQLHLDSGTASYDHVLLGTGYRIDIGKIGVFTPGLLQRIVRIDGAPRLSRQFESSVPGLYFVGSSSMRSFGPLMRFIAGSRYTARTVTRTILATRGQRRRRSATKIALRPQAFSGEAIQRP